MDKETREALDAERKEREAEEKAARAAEPVNVRVLPKGHKKVHKGSHNPRTGASDVFIRGDKFDVARGIAEELEDRGLVEIQADEAPAEQEQPDGKKAAKGK